MLPVPGALALLVLAALWAAIRIARRPATTGTARAAADFALARTLARRGASSETIAREARLAHDVATLARHVGYTAAPARRRKNLPPAAGASAPRHKASR